MMLQNHTIYGYSAVRFSYLAWASISFRSMLGIPDRYKLIYLYENSLKVL